MGGNESPPCGLKLAAFMVYCKCELGYVSAEHI